MKSWEKRVKDWCRSLGLTVVATLIVAAILGTVLYITPSPTTQNGLTIKSGRRPALKPEMSGDPGTEKVARLPRPGTNTVLRAVSKKEEEDPASEPTSPAGEFSFEPQTKDGFGDHAPAQTPIGSTSVGDGKVTVVIPEAGAAEHKKSGAQWKKDLLVLHKKFHPRRGSETAKRQAREKVEAELEAINDSMAVPAIWSVFAGSHDHGQLVARVLARIKSAEGTKMLAALSVYSPDEKARRLATNALRTRDPTEFVEPLIIVFNNHLKCRPGWIEIAGGGRAQVLSIEGERADYQFLYPPPEQPASPSGSRGVYSLERPYMNPQQRKMAEAYNRDQVAMARAVTQAQLKADIEQVDRLNQRIDLMNARAVEVLREATGSFILADREAWRRWLAERQGYPYVPTTNTLKPTIAQVVPPLFSPTFIPIPVPT